jgi:hypothetical protein
MLRDAAKRPLLSMRLLANRRILHVIPRLPALTPGRAASM